MALLGGVPRGRQQRHAAQQRRGPRERAPQGAAGGAGLRGRRGAALCTAGPGGRECHTAQVEAIARL